MLQRKAVPGPPLCHRIAPDMMAVILEAIA
jgi:hypothetical protein